MPQRQIKVVPYDARWPELYEEEAGQLRAVFGNLLVEIHHIGSTSVPGLAAKPVIDMMPLVAEIAAVDALNDAMIALGYLTKGEAGIPGRRFFIKPTDSERTHHVHVFETGSPGALRHLAFRDYLRSHPQAAQEYARLKLELAQQFPEDIYAYMDGKDAWIKETELKALAWRSDQQPT